MWPPHGCKVHIISLNLHACSGHRVKFACDWRSNGRELMNMQQTGELQSDAFNQINSDQQTVKNWLQKT